MELYISGKEADLSEWDTAIKNYENERSKCRDFNPWNVETACNLSVSRTLSYKKYTDKKSCQYFTFFVKFNVLESMFCCLQFAYVSKLEY